MKTTRNMLAIVMTMAAIGLAASSAWAGPYDNPYGVQWNFIIGQAGSDAPYSCTASPDGTVWIGTMGDGNTGASPALTWGNPKSIYGGSYASGYGQITPQGRILQGNDFPAVPGITGYNQGYSPTVAFAGNDPTAFISLNVNNPATWSDAVPPDTLGAQSHPVSFKITSLAGSPGVDYDGTPSVTLPIKNATGIDPTRKFSHEFRTTYSYFGSAHDKAMGSDYSYYMATGNQGSNPATPPDVFTAGDFSGPYNQSYKPTVGRVSADGTTLYGPAHQPSCGGRSFFNKIDLNESVGKVYAAGYGYTSGGTMNFYDADGPGPLAAVNFNTALPGASDRGIATVFDSTTWAVQRVVTWESSYGGDRIYDIRATPDGGFVVCGYVSGNMGSNVNPAPGTLDGYMEKYDSAGNLAWSYQAQTAYYEYFRSATVDAEGNIYVSGTRDVNPTPGTNYDPILLKFKSDGTLAWTSVIDNGGTVETTADHGNIDKTKIYVLSAYNPSKGGTAWTNTISYLPQGTNENLLQKMSPGNFDDGTGTGTPDGLTNWDDMRYLLANLPANGANVPNDTFDFDGDGDSDENDVDYFMRKIFDSQFGDFNWNGLIDQGDYDLLGGWMPGDNALPLPPGWRGFAGPNTPDLIDLEEWLYLNKQKGPEGDIPEPVTMALLGLAAAGLGGYIRRRRAA